MEKLGIKSAAEFIGSSPYKLREMVRDKQIPHYRIGNRIMFRKESLDEWISKQEAECSGSVGAVK